MPQAGKINVPKTAVVRSAFDAASRTREAQRHYAGADSLSADAALSPAVRHVIMSRARHEVANNGYSAGIISTLSTDTIGRGPQLQLFVSDEAPEQIDDASKIALQRRLARFRKWNREIKLTKKLKIARRAKCVDGETFIRIVSNPKMKSHVKLDVQLYEAEQVQSDVFGGVSDTYPNGVPKEVDGILFDQWGNVEKYRFLLVHPGSNSIQANIKKNSIEVAASNVIHYANITRAGQNRGLSEIVSSLNVFNDLRRFTNATLTAAEVAADISFLLETKLPDSGEESDRDESPLKFMDVVELKKGAGIALPDGYTGKQLSAEHPNDRYTEFCDSKLMEAARPVSMPFNIAKGNSSSYNYASGRLDHQTYHKSIESERSEIEEEILDRLLEIFESIDTIVYAQDYENEDYIFHDWMWDGFGHVDPVKESVSQENRLNNNTTTHQEECAKEGKNWEQVFRQRGREKKMMEKLGITPKTEKPAPVAQPKKEDTDDEEK